VSFVEIETDAGHDAFLLDEPEFFATLKASSRAARGTRGLLGAADLTGLPPRPSPDRRHGGAGSRVLDVGCADAPCWPIWRPRRTSMAAAWN